MKKLKEIELVVAEDAMDGITAMGFVELPAIEEFGYYFNKPTNNYTFSKPTEEQGIFVGPAMIPNKLIYRYDPFTNQEYNVFFSEKTVRKISQQFMINGVQNNITEQHEVPVDGIKLIYSWIVENRNDQAITKWGYDVPKGTWMVAYKIFNEDIKQKIKNGEIKGFSIEAYLSEKFSDQIYEQEMKQKLDEIIKLLNSIEK